MDYYYLLKYSPTPTSGAASWTRCRSRRPISGGRSIRFARSSTTWCPSWRDARAGGPLRIWSAPCATGEEPLTLAMLLEEAGWFDRAPIEIVGSDASRAAIAKAAPGLYGAALVSQPAAGAAREILHADGCSAGRVAPELHRRVTYDVVNLMARDEVAPACASAPMIFCRNVFIYFSDQQHPPRAWRVRAGRCRRRRICASAPPSRCCAGSDVRPPGNRRRVRVRKGSHRADRTASGAAVRSERPDGPCTFGCWSSTIRHTSARSSRRCCRAARSWRWSGRPAMARRRSKLVERLKPDVVTCDLIMPGADGVEFIRQQMAVQPVPIVVVSIAGRIERAGAERPRRRRHGLRAEADCARHREGVRHRGGAGRQGQGGGRRADGRLRQPVLSRRRCRRPRPFTNRFESGRHRRIDRRAPGPEVGHSRGCRRTFRCRSRSCCTCRSATPRPMRKRLDEASALTVIEAREGEEVRPGVVLVAPAGRHLTFQRDGAARCVTRLDVEPARYPASPVGRRPVPVGGRGLRRPRARRGDDRHGRRRARGRGMDQGARRCHADRGRRDVRRVRHAPVGRRSGAERRSGAAANGWRTAILERI